MTTPAYPTSADLARFRRAYRLAPHDPASVPGDALRYHASPPGWEADTGGAWPHERKRGIGYPGATLDAHLNADARREASALRSRAYDHAAILAASDPDTYDAHMAGLDTFAPWPDHEPGCADHRHEGYCVAPWDRYDPDDDATKTPARGYGPDRPTDGRDCSSLTCAEGEHHCW